MLARPSQASFENFENMETLRGEEDRRIVETCPVAEYPLLPHSVYLAFLVGNGREPKIVKQVRNRQVNEYLFVGQTMHSKDD